MQTNFYKYRVLVFSTKHDVAKYYGIKTNELIERHYYCYWYKFFVNKYIGVFR